MHPIAFHLGPGFPVYWYGVMMAVAFVSGMWTAGRRGLLSGVSPEKTVDLGSWIIVGALVGARIMYVVTYWNDDFAGRPLWNIFMLRNGGLVFYGGLMGSSLACILHVWLKKLPLWKMADIMTPSIALGSAFGRIGCLLYGCCYGKACSLPWAVHFPADHPTHAEGVHPTQIYDSLLNFSFYLFLAWLFRRKKFDGQVFAAYLIGYAFLRAFVEMFRGDYSEAHIHAWLTPAQWVGVGTVSTGLILWRILSRRAVSTIPHP